jgi:exosortase K
VAEWWHRRRRTVLWWSLAVGLAAALKWHFSAAEAADIGWMLRPLVLLLRLVAGWHFRRNGSGEWQSEAAGIVLVKACAGINFMCLSLLGWCWLARSREPGPRARAPALEWPLLLAGALVLAWATALLANLLRIVAIVHLQPQLQHWLPPAQAHRLLGLLIYLPALGLQWAWCDPQRPQRALLAGLVLYVLLMLGVPLLTGHAAANRAVFREQALAVLAVMVPIAVAGSWWSRRRAHRSGASVAGAPAAGAARKASGRLWARSS